MKAAEKGKTMGIKHKIIGVAAAVTIVGAGLLGTVTTAGAQEGGQPPAAEQSSRRDAFFARVAEKLGVTPEQLRQGIKDAALDAVNQAEESGKITADQAAKARERINSGKGAGAFLRHRNERTERMHRLRAGIIESASTALGMTPDELKVQLKSGNSIADVAAEQGVSLDAVKAQIMSDAGAKAAGAVAKGRFSQEKADELLAKLAGRLDELLNKRRSGPTE